MFWKDEYLVTSFKNFITAAASYKSKESAAILQVSIIKNCTNYLQAGIKENITI